MHLHSPSRHSITVGDALNAAGPHGPNAASRLDRLLLITGVLAAALVLVALAAPWMQDRVYVRDDLPSFHLPMRALYAASLNGGENILWFPELFGGFYAHGEGQVGMLHPLHLLMYATLPLTAAFNLELLLSYVALLAGMFRLLRHWGFDRGPAIVGALMFAFSGFNLLHFVHPNMVAVIAHTPWLILGIDVAITSSDPKRAARGRLAVGLLTTSQLLLGHPQAVWLSGVLEALYTLVRAPGSPALSRRLSALLAGKALGVLGGSIQLLPTWDALSASIRAPGSGTDASFSLVAADLTQLVAPYLANARVFGGPFPQEFSIYCGAAGSVSLLWVLIRRRSLPAALRRPAIAALALVLLGTVLALGGLPLFGLFRSSGRYVALVHFGMAVCGAVALTDIVALSTGRAAAPRAQLLGLALLPLTSALVVVGAMYVRARPQVAPHIAAQLGAIGPALGGLALVTLATLLFALGARGWKPALPLLVLFAACDQGFYGVSFLRSPHAPVPFDSLVSGQAPPPEWSDERVQSDNNILALRGVRLAGGYAALRPAGQLEELNPQRLRLAGVRWVQSATPWSSKTAVPAVRPDWRGQLEPAPATHDGLGRPSTWWRVLRPRPRAWLVASEVVSDQPERDIGSIDIETTAVVPQGNRLTPGTAGVATVVGEKAGRIRVAVNASSRQLLVVSERWHAGWQVAVDGHAETVIRANGDFIGAVSEAGQRLVEFRFRPASFRVGAWLSGLGLGLLLVLHTTATRGRAVLTFLAARGWRIRKNR